MLKASSKRINLMLNGKCFFYLVYSVRWYENSISAAMSQDFFSNLRKFTPSQDLKKKWQKSQDFSYFTENFKTILKKNKILPNKRFFL